MPQAKTLNARDAKLVQWLTEAYSKEAELEADLTAHISLTEKMSYKKRLRKHLTETRDHKRRVGARIRFIEHGDVSAALLAVQDESPVDLLWGIGGTPEGVISAASIKCMGGQLLGRLWPRNDEERNAALEQGYDLDEVLDVNRLVSGNDVFFAATGVTDGDVLDGVHYTRGGASTESLVMRSRSGTVRRVSARHDRAKLREISGERVG